LPDIPSLGPRGEGWVWIQLALLLAIVVALVVGPRWPDGVQAAFVVAGALLALAGAAIGFAAGRALGSGLVPHPKPPSGSELVERGPYRHVRHPFYSGALLFSAGLSLAFSQLALVLTLALAVVWALKAVVEERFLVEAHPEYADYARRTRSRLVPYLF
jgi:protein-S-isoprenylcysteine O-methyltransferase Ste14